jgi:N-acetylneuraminate synthase
MSIYIVGEIGINHNGDIEIAKSLIDEAKVAGADAVKFQKRNIDLVYSKSTLDALRDSPWGTTQREQKEGLEFDQDNYEEIDNYCKEKEIDWFASAWDLDSQEFLRSFDCKKNKIASAMLIYDDLLHMVADEKKHTFISTGMASMDDISNAVKIFEDKNCPFELMHTVSTYPMDEKNANLKVIETLRKEFNCDVGYSGHESGLAVSYAAAAMGITSLERHITLDRAMYGSDQAASLEPSGFKQLIGAVRKIELAMGDGVKRFIDDEKPIAEKLREHIN